MSRDAERAKRSKLLRLQQERMHEEFESKKKKYEQSGSSRNNFVEKFSSVQESSETSGGVEKKTYGLVTLQQMEKETQHAEDIRKKQMLADEKAVKAAKKRKKVQQKATLSFTMDDDEEDDVVLKPSKKSSSKAPTSASEKDSTSLDESENETDRTMRRLGKNPEVDTTYLPDKEKDERLRARKEELLKEWVVRQEEIKAEKALIGFSYWDGSDHMRKVVVTKGVKISTFLKKALKTLRRDHPELRNATCDDMLFIRDNVIIPTHFTFYDLILHEAHNRGQLLFDFDGKKLKKEDPKSSKICQRSWYESNKHIFPATAWEAFDQAVHMQH